MWGGAKCTVRTVDALEQSTPCTFCIYFESTQVLRLDRAGLGWTGLTKRPPCGIKADPDPAAAACVQIDDGCTGQQVAALSRLPGPLPWNEKAPEIPEATEVPGK